MFKKIFRDPETQVDDRLRSETGGAIGNYSVSTKQLPAYRFVDMYRAIEHVVAGESNVRTLEAVTSEDLNFLIHGEQPNWVSRRITRSGRTAWPVSDREEVFLPVDKFWIFKPAQAGSSQQIIVRLRFTQFDERTVLELAGPPNADIDDWIAKIIGQSQNTSIFRGQLLSIAYESGTKDEYGDVERAERLRINFKVASPVPEEDFVVDESLYKVLWRNVIDLHERRDQLRANGIPIRRGVLMYGPPGTGKTFACRFICGRLPNTTRITVAGSALNRVAQVFEFARAYQPSILFLEDVDLVFASRDISLYGSALGDLLDQMDGLRPFEDVTVVLTTNSIERMEAAIRDRPGRISQCIYFGPPADALRERYIIQYAKEYDYKSADMDELVRMSAGTTPAFIKEWVHRTAQIASERVENHGPPLVLRDEHFVEAFAEMKRYTEGSTGRIIGFLQPGS